VVFTNKIVREGLTGFFFIEAKIKNGHISHAVGWKRKEPHPETPFFIIIFFFGFEILLLNNSRKRERERGSQSDHISIILKESSSISFTLPLRAEFGITWDRD